MKFKNKILGYCLGKIEEKKKDRLDIIIKEYNFLTKVKRDLEEQIDDCIKKKSYYINLQYLDVNKSRLYNCLVITKEKQLVKINNKKDKILEEYLEVE